LHHLKLNIIVCASGCCAAVAPNIHIRLEAFSEFVVDQANGIHGVGGLVKVQTSSNLDYVPIAQAASKESI